MRTAPLLVLVGLLLCAACGHDPAPLTGPACARPAALVRYSVAGDTYVVTYAQTVADPAARTADLEARYDFRAVLAPLTPPGPAGFAAALSTDVVQAIRCEAGIARIEEAVVRP